MPLIKDGQVIDDPWHPWSDADPSAAAGDNPLMVSLDQWRTHRQRLAGRNAPLGLVLAAGETPEDLVDDLHRFDVIALDFPAFTDGRAYSSARVLRQRLGFGGELRAVGNVLRDQLMFMVRCGFDAFEIESDTAAEGFAAALTEISVWYQAAADNRTPASRLRPGHDSAFLNGTAG